MRCLSCKRPLTEPALFFLSKILLCGVCMPMAVKAAEDLEYYLEESRAAAYRYLEQHILGGGLLRPGSGMESAESETTKKT